MRQTRFVLRRLLRLVDRHVTSHTGNVLWRNYLLKEFRREKENRSQQEIQHWITCAGQYADLIHSVQSHKVLDITLLYGRGGQSVRFLLQLLLESYNITTDKDAQQRELIEKTAKRVGFKLPQTRQN